ncbi:pseudouridylate synthase RPUSD2-like [Liolophura sinensis]|uniref:pseudouridylate synthase RPUSD2-like n=1 Tax=Liolophura sinensis TaxID=3198878 RepID=UPI0031598E22
MVSICRIPSPAFNTLIKTFVKQDINCGTCTKILLLKTFCLMSSSPPAESPSLSAECIVKGPESPVKKDETDDGPSKKKSEPQCNLSKRAKRRMAKIEMMEKNKNHKEQKRLRKLADPNADLNAGFSQDIFGETDYYFENGLRKVYPYYYTFTAFAKRRWVGRSLLEVTSAEFRAENEDYYRRAIESGAMTVNGEIVNLDYKLKDNDLVQNTIHRHENPVCDQTFEVLHEDKDVVVINKPSSIPCHPCGRYRFNSAVFILGKEMKQSNLRNIYRLDRLTSGVMVCGKTAKRTLELERHVRNREVEKEYVCRVVGEFPDGRISVDQPIDCLSNRVSVWKVSANGKASQTFFEKMSYNGKTSVVKCFPKTGRTHQIRVHLQYLGFPIVNDPIYNSEAFGPLRGKGGDYGKSEAEVIQAIEKEHNVGEWEEGENPLFAEKMRQPEEIKSEGACVDGTSSQDMDQRDDAKVEGQGEEEISGGVGGKSEDEPTAKRLKMTDTVGVVRQGFDLEKWKPDINCQACRRKYRDPSPSDLIMYLHALRYKGPDWDYQTALPDWAKEDFVKTEPS